MLSVIDGAATAHTISSLRAACELLDAAGGRISGVSVSGVLPEVDDPSLPVLTVAQRLASEHGLAVTVSVEDRRFVVQFRRAIQGHGAPLSEAG
ncbi:MAG TPA: hypothetical protein VFH90_03375 [Candidatus Limnocylindria bacterium]|nr:hypothetical protein [Candidatus Limnocylindria bacterium]